MIRPTASSIGLALHCGYPWAPGAPGKPDRLTTDNQLLGTHAGEHAERALRDASYVCPEGASPGAKALVAFIREEPRPGWVPEIPLAWDVVTGEARVLPSKGHRDYSAARDTEFVGTADVVTPTGVIDWKTYEPDHRPRDSGQLRMLALAVATAHGFTSIDVTYGIVSADGVVMRTDTLDALDLDTIRAELRSWKPTDPQPGPHCYGKWCPIVSECPVTAKALVTLGQHPLSVHIDTPEQAAKVRVGLKIITAAADIYKEALEEFVRRTGPIPIGNGKVYGLRTQVRESVKVVEGIVPRAAIEQSTSKAAIVRAVGKAEAEGVIQRLRDVGAVKETPVDVFKEWSEKT